MTGVKQLLVLLCLALMGVSLVQGGEEIWSEQSDQQQQQLQQQQQQQQQQRLTQDTATDVPTVAPSLDKPGSPTSVPTTIGSDGTHKPSVVAVPGGEGTQKPSTVDEAGSTQKPSAADGPTQKPAVVDGSIAPTKESQPSSEPAPSIAPNDVGSRQPISANITSEQPTSAGANATGTNTVAPNNNDTSGGNTASSEPSLAPTIRRSPTSHNASHGTVAPSQAPSENHPTKPTHKSPVSPTHSSPVSPTHSSPVSPSLHHPTHHPTTFLDDDNEPSSGGGHRPSEKPHKYIPKDDDPVKTEQTLVPGWVAEEQKETNEQLLRDKRLLISFGTLLGFTFLVLVLTAQQLLENPHGCCASLCRLTVTCLGCLVRCVCYPCRAVCGNRDRRTHDLMMSDRNSYTHDLELN